ncbi:MAG: DinB family protein [Cyclobacteriaceae bacterium]|nr:DinB family protein [Cyclobacteriaceae bacterium]
MKTLPWFDRKFDFGLPVNMLPFFLERLEGTIIRIEHKVKGKNEKFLSEKFNDKWSVKQHIVHLAEVDQINNRRVDEMKAGVEVLSPAVFEPKDCNLWSIEKVLDYFRTARMENLAKYKSLSEAELAKSSIHPRLKVPMTAIDLAFFDAEHDDHHLLKISETISDHVHA